MTLMLINSPEMPKNLDVLVTDNLVTKPEAIAPVTSLETYREIGRLILSPSDELELEASIRSHPAGSAFKHKKLMLQ